MLDQLRQLPPMAKDGNQRRSVGLTNTTLYGGPHPAPHPPPRPSEDHQYTGFPSPPDLPSLPESDNEEPPTYTPTPLKFSNSSPGYAPSSPQIHPSSYDYAPSSPRYSPSSPFDAPTSPKFSLFSLGYAPSPLQPNAIGNQVTQGIQVALSNKPQQPPLHTGYNDLLAQVGRTSTTGRTTSDLNLR